MPYTPMDSKRKILEEILNGSGFDYAQDLKKRYKSPPKVEQTPPAPDEEDPLKDADPEALEKLIGD